MELKIKTFGIASDIMGGKEVVVSFDGQHVSDLKAVLVEKYPALKDLRSLFIGVNHEYADDTKVLQETDEIALIPPVSGG